MSVTPWYGRVGNIYTGARYVPLFDGAWDSTKTYEPLTVVLYEGGSYTSRQPVPAGIAIQNEEYWAPTGNYNAQIEQYRSETAEALRRASAAQIDADEAYEEAANANGAVNNDLRPRVSALETDNEQNKEDIEELKESVAIVPDQIVVIGDSWADPTNGGVHLIPCLRDSLGANPNDMHNYAVNGTGFIRDRDPNFSAQLADAISDTSFQNARVKYVIVIGGSNDYQYEPTNATTYATIINSMMQSIHSAFENAVTHIFFMQAAKNRKYPYSLISSVIEACDYKNIHNAAWPLSFNLFQDNLHPNAAGYKEFARYITETIQGGTYEPHVDIQDFTSKFNAQFADFKYPATSATIRTTWNETVSYNRIDLNLAPDQSHTGELLNGYVSNVNTGVPITTDNTQPVFYLSSVGIHSGNRYIQTVVVPDGRIGFITKDNLNLAGSTLWIGNGVRVL